MNEFKELSKLEKEEISGGCGWCHLGGVLVIAGGFILGGPLGGGVAILTTLPVYI